MAGHGLRSADTFGAVSWPCCARRCVPRGRSSGSPWESRRKNDPVDQMLRGDVADRRGGCAANWSDNPWFPERARTGTRRLSANQPDQYDHIWQGGYATVTEGAYYAQSLAQARQEKAVSAGLLRIL